jgi:Plasmid pRiA4b ORF-3-like protein
MVQPNAPVEIYQLHILLLQINPPIWRRLHVRSDSSIATLHELLQIAFDWSDFHLHRFVIRGKEYGLSRMGCTTFAADARKVLLSQFRFRVNERFLYEYDFGDLWKHQIRFEGVWPIRGKKIYPVCVDGACASPSEDCGGPEAYMGKIDHHRWNPPLDELQLIADAIGRVLDSQGEERIRDVLGDVDALKEAVDRLETYERFQPARFDRRKLNRRLEQYAQGDEKWRWE